MNKKQQNIEPNRQLAKRYLKAFLVKYEKLVECVVATSEYEMMRGNLMDTISMRRQKQVLFALKQKE